MATKSSQTIPLDSTRLDAAIAMVSGVASRFSLTHRQHLGYKVLMASVDAAVVSVLGLLCVGSEGASTASDSGGYVDSRAAGERRPL